MLSHRAVLKIENNKITARQGAVAADLARMNGRSPVEIKRELARAKLEEGIEEHSHLRPTQRFHALLGVDAAAEPEISGAEAIALGIEKFATTAK